MTAEEQDKLRVLVVDDNPEWTSDLKQQGDSLSTSRLEIQPINSFSQGLEFLRDKADVDLVVVDLYLDNNHRAFEFIDQAKKLGLQVPFVIVTEADQANAIRDNSEQFDRLVGSSGTEFIEKTSVRNFQLFQRQLLDLYWRFREHIDLLGALLVLTSETQDLNRLLSSYKSLVKHKSFPRLCAASESTTKRMFTLIYNALQDLTVNEQNLRSTNMYRPVSIGHKSTEQPNDVYSMLATQDFVPYCTDRSAVLRLVDLVTRKVSGRQIEPDDLQKMNTQLLDAEQKKGVRFAEAVILRCARKLAADGHVHQGLELLFQFSVTLAGSRQRERLFGVDLLIAQYLRSVGREDLASRYYHSAERMAHDIGDQRLLEAVDLLYRLPS